MIQLSVVRAPACIGMTSDALADLHCLVSGRESDTCWRMIQFEGPNGFEPKHRGCCLANKRPIIVHCCRTARAQERWKEALLSSFSLLLAER
jgi:hypothetical protein